MGSTFERLIRDFSFFLIFSGILVCVQSCGVVGPPLPPEDIGIEAKIRSQNQAAEGPAEKKEQEVVPIEEQDVSLPPLRPVGSQ